MKWYYCSSGCGSNVLFFIFIFKKRIFKICHCKIEKLVYKMFSLDLSMTSDL